MKNVHYVIVVVLVLSGVQCSKSKKATVFTETHIIGTIDLKDVVVQTGEVQPLIKVEVKSEASGKIETISIREGQQVAKGDLLFVIDPSRLTFQKKKLDLSIKRAELDIKIAARNYDDAKKLSASGTISEKQLFDLETQKEAAAIVFQQQMLELNDITYQLGKTRVTSPMDGVVISLDVEEGEIAVSATSGFQGGTPLATIADTKKLEVVSRIGEADYLHLKTGQKVLLKPEATRGTYTTGTINFIALSAKKEASDELGTFEVRVAIDSLIPGIIPGINITTEFVIMEKNDVLGLPNRFVTKGNKGFTVLKVANGDTANPVLTLVPVNVGTTDYTNYEILDGVKKGDIVVFRDSLQSPPQNKRPSKGR